MTFAQQKWLERGHQDCSVVPPSSFVPMVKKWHCSCQTFWSVIDSMGRTNAFVKAPESLQLFAPPLVKWNAIAQKLRIGLSRNDTKPCGEVQDWPRGRGDSTTKLHWAHHSCWCHHEGQAPCVNQSMKIPGPISWSFPARYLVQQHWVAWPLQGLLSYVPHVYASIMPPSGNRRPLVKRAADTQLLFSKSHS